MSKLVILRGYPGCGKNYLCERASRNVQFKLVDPDIINSKSIKYKNYIRELRLKDSNYSNLLEATKKYRYNLYETIEYLRSGDEVVWCQCWSKNDGINYTIEKVVEDNPNTKVSIVQLVIDSTISYKRYASKYVNPLSYHDYCNKYTNKFEEYESNGNDTATSVIIYIGVGDYRKIIMDFTNVLTN